MGAAGTRQTRSLPPFRAAPHRNKALRANRAATPPITCVLHAGAVRGFRGRCAIEMQVNIQQSEETICTQVAQHVSSHRPPELTFIHFVHSIAGISCPSADERKQRLSIGDRQSRVAPQKIETHNTSKQPQGPQHWCATLKLA